MSEQGRHFEGSNEKQSMAEAGFEQARRALESFLDGAQQTANSIDGRNEAVRDSVRDISSKAISFAQQNMTASLDYAEKLLRARDLSEVMRLNTEYVRDQMKALTEQASEIGQRMGQAALGAGKPQA
ncbi:MULTISPECIES: phasin family protein [unclassified Nitrobacter]|uniref:phasin family protein n=1 Tax=unclassified Nitrobacter TaxID=2620411 RepID=UPI00030438E7|nr:MULTISPECIES: phasin family protein [unclassified Nitrobacter]MCB1393500.1 phasin family protein [Nitrobacter sp.]MCV0387138.1 phasin family protein [Nitrobacter sp.]